MRRALLLLVVVFVTSSSVAHAGRERAVALSVSGGGAIMGDAEAVGPDRFGSLLGASLSWDRPAPDFPASGTAVVRGDIVPEVTLLALGDRGAVLAGLRLEIDMAQRHMGLFRASARASVFLAPRVGVIDEGGSAVIGGDFGEVFYLGRSDWRVGVTFGVLTWHEDALVPEDIPDGVAQFRIDPGSHQIAMTMGLIVTR